MRARRIQMRGYSHRLDMARDNQGNHTNTPELERTRALTHPDWREYEFL
jgi:hypothetical protein